MSDKQIVSYRRRGRTGRLTLCGIADIFEAAEIRGAASKALEDTKAVIVQVDFTGLERMDLSTMQTLLAVKREVVSAGRSIEFMNLPDVEQSRWTRIGITL